MKLQLTSISFAVVLVCIIGLLQNVYRVQRISDWSFNAIFLIIMILIVISMIGFAAVTIKSAWTWRQLLLCIICSLAYFVCFHLLLAWQFPIPTHERLFPIISFGIYGLVMLYPFYLMFIQSFVKKISL